MKRHDRPFIVGRRTPRETTVVLLRDQPKALFRGPWTVRAVVTARSRVAPTTA
jgi:hypothetical protein